MLRIRGKLKIDEENVEEEAMKAGKKEGSDGHIRNTLKRRKMEEQRQRIENTEWKERQVGGTDTRKEKGKGTF